MEFEIPSNPVPVSPSRVSALFVLQVVKTFCTLTFAAAVPLTRWSDIATYKFESLGSTGGVMSVYVIKRQFVDIQICNAVTVHICQMNSYGKWLCTGHQLQLS